MAVKRRLKPKRRIPIRGGHRMKLIEIFWGQANEPVQIVPLPKYLQSAKAAMGREVFEQELSEPQALLDELLERVGIAIIEKLKGKISANQKQQAA